MELWQLYTPSSASSFVRFFELTNFNNKELLFLLQPIVNKLGYFILLLVTHVWCAFLQKKENSKRRKDDHNLTRKSKDKKDRVSDAGAKSSHFPARSNVSPYAPPMITMDNDDGIPCTGQAPLLSNISICPTGELLEQNAQALNQISANLSSFMVDNINLFCQTRDNILKIMNELNDSPEVMKQMPPLPVKVNDDLANSILPRTTLPTQS
ncbi:uncharacterized protein LOC130945648 [Arachis stenosperma]|uniref:uncharacterized protein LOC130945648 n=1 Tax=Arachis stenosperma TaxID=217475 RepID=UPI0025ACCEB7|nr:uncharacterized protein LOC130945648 [Arachis stenosperma]